MIQVMSTPKTQTLKLTLAYNGARFKGWQKGNGRTVQSTLIEIIGKALPEASHGEVPADYELRLDGAGRTDAGVHAEGQVASAVVPASVNAQLLFEKVNRHLPADLALVSLEAAEQRFHARYRALAKTYRYTVVDGPVGDPFLHGRAWRYAELLDLDRMRAAAEVFLGQQDFSAFTSDRPKPNKERRIFSIDISRTRTAVVSPVEILVRGDGFLWRQVRIMAATIVAAGAQELSPPDIQQMLASRTRSQAPAPAPSCGLTLVSVEY
ncbi:MAG: tRNA pseudouridine(38-40) synthase TruA [Spirochaetaceae bacterium]|nr:MAG: tRNA pseudouridine(38-40) synthase TruA [Spirochaetaceae bacterium]